MAEQTRSTLGLWIAIGVLAVALAVAVTLLLAQGDPSHETTTSPPVPPPTAAPEASPPTTASPPAPYKGPGRPSPFAASPEETTSRERLLVISRALDEHFKRHYDFPDRLEVLIANDLLLPRDLDDAWGRPVDYTRVAKARFKLCSRGPDATSTTDDDVCVGPGGRDERPGR